MQTANDIRKVFLDFFAKNGHQTVASSPLVPHNDPTLMFTNAGMVQFKNVFTGLEHRAYTRAATSQKCVRAGGKHNDLENVGHTARHHTFFEMLGNFSFGDYFKDDAIHFAWQLITKEYGIDPKRLLVTVYHTDDEAFDIWKKVAGLPDERIIRIPTADNFWSMGDVGPCGPCSEIFYDHGDHIWGGPPGSPEQDGDRFVEIWNLVFMQYEQMVGGERVELPKPSIDTGMGLERITAVMQGVHDNYDIDLMRALILASADATGSDPDGEHRVSHRVIADHLRATAFLIADGVLPSNEGRGYVLRRIMRRAMRHAHMIGATEPVIYKLFPALQAKMGSAFPELGRAEALITETLKLEESRFIKTLDRGLKLLDEATLDMSAGGELDGETAFKLYDTYGFPLDLTQDALKAKNIAVDEAGFSAAMERQKKAARASWAGSGEAATDDLWFDIKDELGATDFLGYKVEEAQGQIKAILLDGVRVDEASKGDTVQLVTNQSPFYGESGGQSGDVGTIHAGGPAGGLKIDVTDTQKKLGALHVHIGQVVEGTVRVGQDVTLSVNHGRRAQLRANHSATHLLHAALRRELGDHVTQKGSMVSADRLRFDISHHKAVAANELADVELMVNGQVRANTAVVTRLMAPEEAVEAGAMALFGEKYGDEVRVVSMGAEFDNGGTKDFSVELCGGTHVKRTGDIGLLKIVSEGAVASGVRRIEALTGAAAVEYLEAQEAALQETASVLKSAPADVPGRVRQLIDDRKKMEREIQDLRKKLASGSGSAGGGESKDVGGITFAARLLDDVPGKELKALADEIKTQIKSGVVALVSLADGKVSLVVGVTADLTDKISAVDLVRAGASAVGGQGGGGRPDMAQAGGPDVDKAQAGLDAIEAMLAG